MSIFQGWRSTILDEEMFLEIPSSPGFPWVHQPAAAREINRVQDGRSHVGFQLEWEREVQKVLSSPSQHFKVRPEPVACKQTCTSMQVVPCAHCWTSVTCHISSSQLPAPFGHLLALGHISCGGATLVLHVAARQGTCEGALLTTLGWEGQCLVSSQHAQLMARGI